MPQQQLLDSNSTKVVSVIRSELLSISCRIVLSAIGIVRPPDNWIGIVYSPRFVACVTRCGVGPAIVLTFPIPYTHREFFWVSCAPSCEMNLSLNAC